jgi:hypothetical protein
MLGDYRSVALALLIVFAGGEAGLEPARASAGDQGQRYERDCPPLTPPAELLCSEVSRYGSLGAAAEIADENDPPAAGQGILDHTVP